MKLAQMFSWRVYHAVHTNGVLADFVYWGAFHVQNALRARNYKRIAKNVVTPEELFAHRNWEPSSRLTTGVTNVCNAKCTFCAYPKVVANKTLQTGVMSFEVFKKAVDEWAALGGQFMDLTPVVGDPLIDPGIVEKIDYARNHAKIKDVVMTTNAILLNHNDTYKRIIDAGVSGVFISTSGANREAYEKTYGVKQYDKMISAVRNLLEYNRSKGEPARIAVRFRNSEKPSQIIRSKDFKEHIKPYLSDRVRVNFTVDFDNWGGTIKPSDIHGNMRMRVLPPALNVPCQRLFDYAVRHDGSVRLCGCRLTRTDLDDLVVGNLKQKSIVEISRSDEAWNLIKGFYRGKRPETCRECTFYQPVDQKWLSTRARGENMTMPE